MIVVGVGCGPGMMTEEAIAKVSSARKVYGSWRALKLAERYIHPSAQVITVADFSRVSEIPDDALVLSTGDPMLSGLGHLGAEVVPGISSLQLAFSRLKLPLQRAVVVDAHARDRDNAVAEALEELERGRIPFLLSDPAFDVGALAETMEARGIKAKIVLCERLGYEDETISFGEPSRPQRGGSGPMSVVLFREER